MNEEALVTELKTLDHRLVLHGPYFEPFRAAAMLASSIGAEGRTLVVAPLAAHDAILSILDPIARSYKLHGARPALMARVCVMHPEVIDRALSVVKKRHFEVLIVANGGAFKNVRAKRGMVLRRRAHEFDRRFVFSCDPKPLEVWPEAWLVDLGEALGKYHRSFLNAYFEPAGYQGREWQPSNGGLIRMSEAMKAMTTVVSQEGARV